MRLEIGHPAERIVQCAIGIEVDRVDREIAAGRILGPIGVEGDPGPPAIGFDIAAQGRDLEMPRRFRGVENGRHGAMLDPGRDRLDPRFVERRDDRLGARRGGEIDVSDRAPEQRIAHAAADKPRRDPGIRQRLEEREGLRRRHPGLRRDLPGVGLAHFNP